MNHVSSNDAGEVVRLRELFDQALEQPAQLRVAWVHAQLPAGAMRTALLRLLQADQVAGVLDAPVEECAARIGEADRDAAIGSLGRTGQRIGPFRLLRMLGEGGMAVVYLAERDDPHFHQQVAIKLLRRGLYSEADLRVYRRERRALAALSHPNIAHLLDGGVTEAGIPYLVIEYVDGVPITRHARALGLRARLRLFTIVCRAVAAAHAALIVHRDLKPGNILVTAQGEVKLLDFGIAKLLDEDSGAATRTGRAALTPGYAAPEQYSGAPITTATDVYALGVLLHELLLGERPVEPATRRPSARAADMVVSGTAPAALPLPPPALRQALRGDLDNITLKALAADPAQRYTAAADLAEDIERHLHARPVHAHPPSRLYRTRKFVQRHRGGVALASVLTLALLAALGAALWQAQVARAAAARADAMRGFIFESFGRARPAAGEAPPSIVEVVQQAVVSVQDDAAMDASVRTELLAQLGTVLRAQGQLPQALELLGSNYLRAHDQLGIGHPATRAAGRQWVVALFLDGDYARARSTVDLLLRHTPPRREATLHLELLRDSARIASLQHELPRAQHDAASALAAARRMADPGQLSSTLMEYGNAQLAAGATAQAIAAFDELLALRRHHLGERHVNVAAVHTALSRAHRRAGANDAAVAHAAAALAIAQATLGADHWRLAYAWNASALALWAQRDLPRAQEAAAEALRVNRSARGDDHPETLNALQVLGRIALEREDYAAAARVFAEALQGTQQRLGPQHPDAAAARAGLGFANAMRGEHAGAAQQLQQAIAALAAAEPPLPRELANALAWRVRLALEQQPAEARAPVAQLAALTGDALAADAGWRMRAALLEAEMLLQQQDAASAGGSLQRAAQALADWDAPDPLEVAELDLLQAQHAWQAGQVGNAVRVLDQAAVRLAALRSPPARLLARERELRARLQGGAPQ